MQQHRFIPRALGAAALAILFGTSAIARDNQPATSGQSDAAPSSQTSGSASDAATSGASGTSGAAASEAAQAGTGQLSKQDRQILRDLARSNLAEIRTSELALERSKDPQIRQYAKRMLDDHQTMQEQVADLARTKDVQLPQQPTKAQQRTADRLAKLQGEEFDRAYREQMGEQAHQKTHDMLTSAQDKAKDPQVTALITQALPIIERHQTLAENMPDQRTSASGASGASDDPGQGAASGSEDASKTEGGTGTEGQTSGGTSSAVEGGTGAESVSSPGGSSNSYGPGK